MTPYVSQIFDALGDPTRRAVFDRVRRGASSVADIARGMDVSRPAVSQHLKVLKEAQLLTDRAEGTRRIYTIDARGVDALRRWLEEFWDTTLAAFKDAVEREAIKERKP